MKKFEKKDAKKVKKIISILSLAIPTYGPIAKELLEELWDLKEKQNTENLNSDLKEIIKRLETLEKGETLEKDNVDKEFKELLTKCAKTRKEEECYKFWEGYVEYYNKNKKSNCMIKLTATQDTINYVRLNDSKLYLEQIFSITKGTVKLGMRIKDPNRFDEIYAKKDKLEKKSGIQFDWSHNNTNSRLVTSIISEEANISDKREKVYKTLFQKTCKLIDALIEQELVNKEKLFS